MWKYRVEILKSKKFIKELRHKYWLLIKGFINRLDLKKNVPRILLYGIEVGFTGIVIYYTLTHFNWISCGLAAALITYYLKWFVDLIKRK